MPKQLFRSKTNRKFGGVCGGIAEYFNIDPTVIRLGWALFFVLLGACAVFAYIAAWCIIPEAPGARSAS